MKKLIVLALFLSFGKIYAYDTLIYSSEMIVPCYIIDYNDSIIKFRYPDNKKVIFEINTKSLKGFVLSEYLVAGNPIKYSDGEFLVSKELAKVLIEKNYCKQLKKYYSTRFNSYTNISENSNYIIELVKLKNNKIIYTFRVTSDFSFCTNHKKQNLRGTISYITGDSIYLIHKKNREYYEISYHINDFTKFGHYSEEKTILFNSIGVLTTIFGGGFIFLRDYYTTYNLLNGKYLLRIKTATNNGYKT